MSNYRIMRIAGLHYKSARKALPSSFFTINSYAEQQKILFENGFVYSDSFSRGMRALGHETHEVVYDFEEMQRLWAKEHGVSYKEPNEILLAQIEKIRPDILFFQDIHSLNYELRKGLKSRFPFIKLLIVFRGFPGESPLLIQEFANADLLFLGSPRLIPKCKKLGLNPHLIYHYFDERLLTKIDQDQPKECSFSFLGSSGFGYGIEYLERYRYLKVLLENTALQAWVDEPLAGKVEAPLPKRAIRQSLKGTLSLLPKKWLLTIQEKGSFPSIRGICEELIVGQSIPNEPLSSSFPQKCYPALFGTAMYQQLYQSRITFNKHTATAKDKVDNIRLFQATGMGSCLLTDRGSNLSELFEEDREVVAYSSLEECLEKANYLLQNESVAREIAKRGQQRVLKDHTLSNRCQQMDALIQKAMKRQM